MMKSAIGIAFAALVAGTFVACGGAPSEEAPERPASLTAESSALEVRFVDMASDTIAVFRAGTLSDHVGVNVLVDFATLDESARTSLKVGSHPLVFDRTLDTYALGSTELSGGRAQVTNARDALSALLDPTSLDTRSPVCGATTLARSGIRQAKLGGVNVKANVALMRESAGGLRIRGFKGKADIGCLWRSVGTITYECHDAKEGGCIKRDYPCYYEEVTVVKGSGKIGIDGCKVQAGGTCSISRKSKSVPIPVAGECTLNQGVLVDDCLCVETDLDEVTKKCQAIRDAENAKAAQCNTPAEGTPPGTGTPGTGGGTETGTGTAANVAPRELCISIE